MEVKIREKKLNFLKDYVFDNLEIDDYPLFQVFQRRMRCLEFLSTGTRQGVVGRYDYDYNCISVFDDKFYDLMSAYVSRPLYDLIKEDLIKKIFKIYTGKYKSIYKEEPKSIKFID